MTRARELSKLGNPNIFSVDSNLNVGVGSLTPDTKLDVIGVVSATSFYGDGSALTGIAGTADVSTSSLVVAGVSTFQNNVRLGDGDSGYPRIIMGNSSDFYIYHSSVNGNILQDVGANGVQIWSNSLTVKDSSVTNTGLLVQPNSSTELYYNNFKKFETTSTGITITGNAGINTTSTPTNLYVSGNAAGNIVGLGTTNANTTLDFSTGNNFSLTLTDSIVLSNPTGVTTGQSGIILISQDGSGSRTCGFGSHWDFPSSTAPTLSTGADALDALTYFVRSSTSIVTNSLIGIGTL